MTTIKFDKNTEEGRTLLYMARTMKRASRKGASTIIIEDDDQECSKEEALKSVQEGLREMKLMKQGKLKARPIKELLDEL